MDYLILCNNVWNGLNIFDMLDGFKFGFKGFLGYISKLL